MIKYEELVKDLSNKKFAPVYLLMGEEPFYIDRICVFFENHIIDEQDRDFNQTVLYGKDTTAADVIASAKQFPFGSPTRVVIVKEAKDLKDIDKLLPYVQNPSPTTILVICYKYGKLKANQYKPYEKSGVVFDSVGVKDYQLADWIQKRAAREKFNIDPYSASKLADFIGNDLSRIYTELQKLKAVLPPGGTITEDVIQQYVVQSKEYNIFELEDAIVSRNTQRTYKIAINFTQHLKDNPNIKTITTLFNFFHKMLRYQLSPVKDKDTQKQIFGNLPPSIMERNARNAMSYTIPQLTHIIAVLREYDVKSKGVDTNSEEGDLLIEMIYKILHA